MYHPPSIPRLGALVTIGLVSLACTDAGGPDIAEMDAYVAGLGSWEAYSPLLPSEDVVTGDTAARTEVIDAVTYACATTPHSLTETPAEIVMYEPNASIMWAGNLVQGRSYKGGLGTFQELSIRQRAPLRLSIDLLTGNNFAIVENPSLTTVQSAIGDLIQRAQDAGHHSGSSINFDTRVTYATDQALLKLGLSAHWIGGKARASLSVQRNAAQRTILAHFVQKMFTVAIELPQSPGGFFSSEFSPALLREQEDAGSIGRDNLPVYLASVTYGRTLTYALTSKYSENRMRAAVSASFNGIVGGGSGYTETELRETLTQDNLRVAAIGGEGQDVLDLISQGNLKAYFTTDAPLTTARPISYQLNYLGDNKLARVSETTAYSLDDCVEVPSGDVVSDFEVDNEDWTLENGTTAEATRVRTAPLIDGDWFIRGFDGGAGTPMYFRAPAKFRGDKSSYYRGNLSFFSRWHADGLGNGSATFADPDVVIVGANGKMLVYRFDVQDWPEDQWLFRQVALDSRAAWRQDGHLATEQQIRDVLANVLQVKIRGEYRRDITDVGYLDRVILSKDSIP